jgi:putative toxin-antitoxin system antitoxin component (TIGR02293 family)
MRPKKVVATGKTSEQRRSVPLKKNFSGIQEFDYLKKISGYSADVLASLLGITSRTLQNKRSGQQLFDLPHTERLRKLIQLFQLGTEIFGTSTEFSSWLEKHAHGLDMQVPIDLLKQPGGLDLVTREIIAIKYGETV